MPDRLPPQPGEWIDRDRPVEFQFEGNRYSGFAGDTISTALWANGVRVLGRSFKYHRPRGIFGLADVDCNAMMESHDDTNIRADLTPIKAGMVLKAVNTFGGVKRDRLRLLDHLGVFTPVGFYYKAFHTPRSLFPFYENRLRDIAGLGRIKQQKGNEPTPKDYAFCDLLVVGGGPSGLSAALTAAKRGARVLLVDENPHLGGSLCYRSRKGPSNGGEQLSRLLEEVSHQSTIEVRHGTSAVGWYADHWVALVDDVRLTKVRSRAVLFATGCYEQPSVFRNNDLPGVMLGSAARRLMHQYAVRPFTRGVVLTANSDGYGVALDLLEAKVAIEAIVDLRPQGEDSPAAAQCERKDIPIYRGHAICDATPARGKRGIRQVALCRLGPSGPLESTPREVLPCDGVAVSVGWAPADGLLRQAGTTMEYDGELEQFVPSSLPPGVFAAGRVNGVYALKARLEDGRQAGQAAAAFLGLGPSISEARPRRVGPFPNHPYPVVPHPQGKNFVDLDEDLQLKDYEDAAQEGFDSPELLKRYSTFGMGPSQGKHSNLHSVRILTRIRGESMVGRQLTTARPFTTPVTLGALAGRIFTPNRRTPTHGCHRDLGAKFMYAGNWLRPEYYPKTACSREECIAQEVLTVRKSVGLIDLGTLGKLEICGPDAARFLERIYTGRFRRLKVGMSRYAVMCDESGTIIDDGMLGRLGEDRFYVSTTSTGSDGVYREFQRWALQWGLDVFLTNATGHYGALNLAGRFSRRLLQPLTDVDLAPEAFPYLGLREGQVAGVAARLSRVGFVGELGYEIHVPADGAIAVWQALMEAGRAFGIRPFGVEAQRLLRLDKSHLIIGQDTDGLTHPFEAGLGWAVKMKKRFFVGQRSLAILRKQGLTRKLIGFTLSEGTAGPRPKECHLVIDKDRISGRVTSVSFSPTLRQVIGLAYVRPDQADLGTKFQIRVDKGVLVEATVTATPFYDPGNLRQHHPAEA